MTIQNVCKRMEFVIVSVENTVGKGLNATKQHVLLFLQYVTKKLSSPARFVISKNCLVNHL